MTCVVQVGDLMFVFRFGAFTFVPFCNPREVFLTTHLLTTENHKEVVMLSVALGDS